MMLPVDLGIYPWGGAVCSRCKRPLSDSVSVKMGIGPIVVVESDILTVEPFFGLERLEH